MPLLRSYLSIGTFQITDDEDDDGKRSSSATMSLFCFAYHHL